VGGGGGGGGGGVEEIRSGEYRNSFWKPKVPEGVLFKMHARAMCYVVFAVGSMSEVQKRVFSVGISRIFNND